MERGVSICLRMLDLSVRRRLILVFCTLVIGLGLYNLAFPMTYFGGMLILPIVCATWLFSWRGGLLAIAGNILLLVTRFVLTFGNYFWTSPMLVSFITGIVYGLAICLVVEILRSVVVKLLNAQQAYQREHALNEWKDQTLQNLNHELRGPLTQTEGYLELLEKYRDSLDAETQASFIAFARSGCEELHNLTRAALEAVQTSGVQLSPHLDIFPLRQEVRAALASCEGHLLKEHPIEIEVTETTQVYADARFVRQVVRNLITNACKYTPPETPISVSVAPLKASGPLSSGKQILCVQVRDQGPGIPPEQQTNLFQRFTRLPSAIASTQPGSGLGLAICKQLVEAMGGSIWVESTGRTGEGCCFSFTLTGELSEVRQPVLLAG